MEIEGHSIDEAQYTKEQVKFLKYMLNAYQNIPNMKGIFRNYNPKKVIEFLLKHVYKELEQHGGSKFTPLAVREIMNWFVGERVEHNPKVTEVYNEVSRYLMKFPKKVDVEVKDVEPKKLEVKHGRSHKKG